VLGGEAHAVPRQAAEVYQGIRSRAALRPLERWEAYYGKFDTSLVAPALPATLCTDDGTTWYALGRTFILGASKCYVLGVSTFRADQRPTLASAVCSGATHDTGPLFVEELTRHPGPMLEVDKGPPASH
jgi:hypothetical protein